MVLYYKLSLVSGIVLQSVIESVVLYYKLSLVSGTVLQAVIESMVLYYNFCTCLIR